MGVGVKAGVYVGGMGAVLACSRKSLIACTNVSASQPLYFSMPAKTTLPPLSLYTRSMAHINWKDGICELGEVYPFVKNSTNSACGSSQKSRPVARHVSSTSNIFRVSLVSSPIERPQGSFSDSFTSIV